MAKRKAMLVGGEGMTSQSVSLFSCLDACFGDDGSLHGDTKTIFSEGNSTYSIVK